MSRDILDEIDGAIGDWQTSDDAMRWTPNRPTGMHVLTGPPRVFVDARQPPGPLAHFTIDMSGFVRATVQATAAMARFGGALEQVAEMVNARTVADRSTGPGRHGAVKHARDLRRAFSKRVARRLVRV